MRKFGLIGFPLSHSFSKRFFAEKFEAEGITDCLYELYPLENISELPAMLLDKNLCGLNVTIPYKERVIPFLDFKNEIVARINACNCIRIRDGRLYGYNTDAIGFQRSLVKKLGPGHDRALILGTGGASKAVEYVLGQLGISYRYVSRTPRTGFADLRYEEVSEELLLTHTLVINTTPLGMYPRTEECPPLPYQVLSPKHYLYDLVYNPARTLFLQKGEEHGATVENGYEMLIIQAEESWKIWNE
ncbi:MAG: shikimate dehydrogenase [Puia sp.]|nr:shikimate dehydrogenase [Puia sp.]